MADFPGDCFFVLSINWRVFFFESRKYLKIMASTHIFIIFKPSWCQLKRGKKQLKTTNIIALSYGSVLRKLVCANNQNILYSSLRSRSKMLLQLSAVFHETPYGTIDLQVYCLHRNIVAQNHPHPGWKLKKIFQICHPKNGLFVHQNAPKTKDTLIIDTTSCLEPLHHISGLFQPDHTKLHKLHNLMGLVNIGILISWFVHCISSYKRVLLS